MLRHLVLPVILCASAYAQTSEPCLQFTVVTQDKLKNFNQGLSADDQKWFHEKVQKKAPSLCYVDPSPAVPLVFFITVTPDTYHGTRVVTNTSTASNPVNGTITDQDGNTSQVSGTVESTSTSSVAVPYSFEYGIFTLSLELQQRNGTFALLHRFEQKGIYRTLYGIPLGGKGHHPAHAVIEEAADWINRGGLTRDERLAAQAPISVVSQPVSPPQSHADESSQKNQSSSPSLNRRRHLRLSTFHPLRRERRSKLMVLLLEIHRRPFKSRLANII